MTCAVCAKPLTGRQTRHCSPLCSSRAFTAARRADGRLREYRQREDVKARNRALMQQSRVVKTCAWCGVQFECSITHDAEQRYCGRSCAGQAKRPATRCAVPSDHPSRWFGTSCRIPDKHPSQWYGGASPVNYGFCGWCERTMVVGPESSARTYCTPRCSARAGRMRRRSRESADGGTYTWGEFMRVAARFAFRCAYCGVKPGDQLDPDHVVPISRGGSNTTANLLPSCRACNSDKRDLLLREWNADRARRGLPPRRVDWDFSDQRFFHLTYLTAAEPAA